MSQDSQDRRSAASLYTQLDISHQGTVNSNGPVEPTHAEHTALLQEVLAAQDRTNELLEELVASTNATQKQRGDELTQWKQANPELAEACRDAAEGLSRVQVEFLHKMTEEVNDTVEGLMDGEFMLTEFIDRFGPRLAHLNGVIQVLSQLSSAPNPTETDQQQP